MFSDRCMHTQTLIRIIITVILSYFLHPHDSLPQELLPHSLLCFALWCSVLHRGLCAPMRCCLLELDEFIRGFCEHLPLPRNPSMVCILAGRRRGHWAAPWSTPCWLSTGPVLCRCCWQSPLSWHHDCPGYVTPKDSILQLFFVSAGSSILPTPSCSLFLEPWRQWYEDTTGPLTVTNSQYLEQPCLSAFAGFNCKEIESD